MNPNERQRIAISRSVPLLLLIYCLHELLPLPHSRGSAAFVDESDVSMKRRFEMDKGRTELREFIPSELVCLMWR